MEDENNQEYLKHHEVDASKTSENLTIACENIDEKLFHEIANTTALQFVVSCFKKRISTKAPGN